jgi:hypothetical protein
MDGQLGGLIRIPKALLDASHFVVLSQNRGPIRTAGFSTAFQATIGRVGTIWALDGNSTQRLMGGRRH